MNLEGKTALVFAAGGAVGGAVARRLARLGARVFASARSEGGLRALEGVPGLSRTVVDAMDDRAIAQHVDDVARSTGRIDVVFNAIGPRPHVTRLVVRQDVAEDLCQQAAVRMLEASHVPAAPEEFRPWLYKVVTNLAIDYLRKHSTWRETLLVDARGLLLKEVCGFTTEMTAEILSATFAQTKNHLQDARRRLSERYATSCALVSQQGACHQCVELDEFFNGTRADPLDGTSRDIDARLAVLRERRSAPLGPWHRKMMALIDEILGE